MEKVSTIMNHHVKTIGIVLFVLVGLLIFPLTRPIVIFLLPLGLAPDDIFVMVGLFAIVAISMGALDKFKVAWNQTVNNIKKELNNEP